MSQRAGSNPLAGSSRYRKPDRAGRKPEQYSASSAASALGEEIESDFFTRGAPKMPLTRDERARRVAELERWFRDQETEWAGERFPRNVRELWDQHTDELEGHRAALAEFTRRDQRLAAIGTRGGSSEDGTVFPDRGLSSPTGTTADNPRRRADLDNGLAAIERCAKLAGFSNESAQRVEKMLRTTDRDGADARYLAAVGDPDYLTAFFKALPDPARGHLSFTPPEAEAMRRVRQSEQERAMVDSTGAQGGFGLPISIDPSIVLTNAGALNPLRELSRVEQISTYTWRGVSSDGVIAGFGAEASEAVDNSPSLVQPSITTARGFAFIPYSIEFGMDYTGAQEELIGLLSDAKLVVEATKFLLGTGVNEPAGILNIGGTGGLTTTQRVQTATTATFAYADLWTLKQSIPVRFLADSAVVMNPITLDTTYQLSPSGSTTLALLMPQGRNGPLTGMPTAQLSTLATGATTGTKIAVSGNFKKGFLITDRLGAQVEYIPMLFGPANRYPTGQRGLYLFWRTGSTTIGSGSAAGSPLRYLEVK
jgi:HK97 family phage major capsid protein